MSFTSFLQVRLINRDLFSGCEEALQASLEYAGIEKILIPLVPTLITIENNAIVEILISSKRTPKIVLEAVAQQLVLSADGNSSRTLSTMHQRHLGLLQSSIDAVAGKDDALKEKLVQEIHKLSAVGYHHS